MTKTTPTKTDTKAKTVVYQVSGLTSVSHGDEVYPVADGKVELPAAGRHWYESLIQAGNLVPVTN